MQDISSEDVGHVARQNEPGATMKVLVFCHGRKKDGGKGVTLLWDDPEKEEGVEVIVADILEAGEVFVQPWVTGGSYQQQQQQQHPLKYIVL